MPMRFWLLAWMIMSTARAWAADATQPCIAPDTPLRPIMATHTQPPYPPMSVMTHEEGQTLVNVAIGTDGVPTDVTVLKSSGSVRLDQASIDHVKGTWRWAAPVIHCQPSPTQTPVNVTWALREAAPDLMQAVYMAASDYPPDAIKQHEEGTATIGIALAMDGTVAQAVVTQSSGFPDLDAHTLELVRRWHWVPANLNGRTLTSSIYFRVVWRLSEKK